MLRNVTTVDKNIRVPINQVRDYNMAQGVSHPSDLSYQIIRDINIRYITIENSSQIYPVGIAITDSPYEFHVPPINFSLAPGEIRHLGINTIGGPMQYIHILNLETGKHLGPSYPTETNSNQFVLREGINQWFVHPFHRSTYRAAK